jgi:hypothetical protein
MKFDVDISVFTEPTGAYATVTGQLDLVGAPERGDVISLRFPANAVDKIPSISGFPGLLEVKQRIFSVGERGTILLQLDDLVVGSEEDAINLSRYLEKGFGLFVDKHTD